MASLKVGVIFGGRSVEHDVSVVTAHQAMAALAPNHEVVPVYVTREGKWLTDPGLNDLTVYRDKRWDSVGTSCSISPETGTGGLTLEPAPQGGLLKRSRDVRHLALDVVIPAIHGTFGEDGTLQGLLELADIPYAGCNSLASAVGMDKPAMKACFRDAGIAVLDHIVVHRDEILSDLGAAVAKVEDSIGYPAFAKPSRLGSSVGIGKAKDRATLEEVLQVAATYDRRILVEPSAEGCVEINCSVLGGYGFAPQASVCEQPVAWEEFLSFEDKYMRGGKDAGTKDAQGMEALDRRIPAPITEELTTKVQDLAVRAFESIDAAGVSRIDCFVKQETGEAWVNEINTIPGSFAFYLWEHSGIDFSGLMQSLIDIALAGHRQKQDLMFTYESGMLDKDRGGSKRG
jgi:D-alanine-D-alanine ligase